MDRNNLWSKQNLRYNSIFDIQILKQLYWQYNNKTLRQSWED